MPSQDSSPHDSSQSSSATLRFLSVVKTWRPNRTLISILLLALIQAMVFISIIPPWWHYDEPGHFEYAWLVANLPTWPKPDQYDQGMRRQMADSLNKYGWYQIRNYHPDLSGSGPIPIGVSQVHDPPAFYFLASMPLRFLHNADITVQYYAARSVPFVLYLLILLVVWFAMGELLPDGHPLRWMVPAFLALLPAFVDTMTAVNNDVSAVLAATIFLWASLRLMKRGHSLGRVLFLGFALVFCALSKNTAWFTFLLAPLVLLFGWLRGRYNRFVLGAAGIGALIALFGLFQADAPSGWYQLPGQATALRVRSASAPLGSYVFQIQDPGGSTYGRLLQFFSPDLARSLKGQSVTLGEWVWSDQAGQIPLPYLTIINSDNTLATSPQTAVELNITPTFYRIVYLVPDKAYYVTLTVPDMLAQSSNQKIFFDGLVLARGEFSINPPHFTDPNGTMGTWDGQNFQNLIVDGSAELAALRIRHAVDERTTRPLSAAGVNLPLIVSTLQDLPGNGWYYRDTVATLFRTFWASLAGDKVVLPGSFVNYFLALITLLGAAGAALLMWLRRKDLRWDILFVLALALAAVWGLAATRGVSSYLYNNPFFFPWARYADPAIFPTALVLCAGWWQWLELLRSRFKLSIPLIDGAFLGGMFGLALLAAITAIQAFHDAWWQDWGSLVLLGIFQFTAFLVISRVLSRRTSPSPLN